MKQTFLLFTFSILTFSLFAFGDTIKIEPAASKMAFVKFSNTWSSPTISYADNTDWHLAFSCKPAQPPSNTLLATTIRYNGAAGMRVYRVTGKHKADFNALTDTLGLSNWTLIEDQDTSWWMGAFNVNRNPADQFNYGWGEYNFATHSVLGDSLYVIKLPTGNFKKFVIQNLSYDTAYNIQYANLDGSALINQEIRKAPYQTKNFVYLNLDSAKLMDKEPASTNWDWMVFRYKSPGVTASNPLDEVGILQNDGGVAGFACRVQNDITKTDTIGHILNRHLRIAYQAYSNHIVYINSFDDSITGNIVLYNVVCEGIHDSQTLPAIKAFPNPTNDLVYFETTENLDWIEVSDYCGRLVNRITQSKQISLANLEAGIYFLKVKTDKSTYLQRIVKE